MTGIKTVLIAFALICLVDQGHADMPDRIIGGDIVTSGESGAPLQAARDVLAAGATVLLSGAVAQDVHAAGFDVEIEATTGGDLYAFGFSTSLRGPVGGDMSASGMSVRTAREAEVTGNARLFGGRVIINGPIKGALAAAGGRITLNAHVAGDVLLAGETIDFGADARIGGSLTYSAPERIVIPDHIIPADRVVYEPFERSEVIKQVRDHWGEREYPVFPRFLTVLSGFLVTLGFFVLIGALLLTLAPTQVRNLRRGIDERLGMALLSGVIGLSMLFGLVPISLLTVVGIPLVPVILLLTFAVWTLGYILGAYVITMRVMRGFGTDENPTIWIRLIALVIGISLFALLNFIPVLGWMINFAIVLLGVGGITTALFGRMVGNITPTEDVEVPTIEQEPE